jgi:bifunctional pyridoxal-dependent enzyme with beta-cystathionase and maltose regulon repressor activities
MNSKNWWDICVANDVIIISDEIHFDLIRPGYHHTVLATLSQKAADHCVVLTAPSKNIQLGRKEYFQYIIPNQKLT